MDAVIYVFLGLNLVFLLALSLICWEITKLRRELAKIDFEKLLNDL